MASDIIMVKDHSESERETRYRHMVNPTTRRTMSERSYHETTSRSLFDCDLCLFW